MEELRRQVQACREQLARYKTAQQDHG